MEISGETRPTQGSHMHASHAVQEKNVKTACTFVKDSKVKAPPERLMWWVGGSGGGWVIVVVVGGGG